MTKTNLKNGENMMRTEIQLKKLKKDLDEKKKLDSMKIDNEAFGKITDEKSLEIINKKEIDLISKKSNVNEVMLFIIDTTANMQKYIPYNSFKYIVENDGNFNELFEIITAKYSDSTISKILSELYDLDPHGFKASQIIEIIEEDFSTYLNIALNTLFKNDKYGVKMLTVLRNRQGKSCVGNKSIIKQLFKRPNVSLNLIKVIELIEGGLDLTDDSLVDLVIDIDKAGDLCSILLDKARLLKESKNKLLNNLVKLYTNSNDVDETWILINKNLFDSFQIDVDNIIKEAKLIKVIRSNNNVMDEHKLNMLVEHSRATSKFAIKILNETLDVSLEDKREKFTELVRVAGLLHDVMKIAGEEHNVIGSKYIKDNWYELGLTKESSEIIADMVLYHNSNGIVYPEPERAYLLNIIRQADAMGKFIKSIEKIRYKKVEPIIEGCQDPTIKECVKKMKDKFIEDVKSLI